MVLGLKVAIASAILLLPIAYPHSALSRNWSLSYQEAVWMCSTGDHQACDVTYRYEMSRPAVPAGTGTDAPYNGCAQGRDALVDGPPEIGAGDPASAPHSSRGVHEISASERNGVR